MMYTLDKDLCGLKQESQAWYKYLKGILEQLGFEASEAEGTVFINREDGEPDVYLVSYVEDLLLVGQNERALSEYAQRIGGKVEVRVEERIYKFLGLNVERDWKNVRLNISNPMLTRSILHRFNMHKAKPDRTPLPEGINLEKEEVKSNVPYKEVVGVLLYLSNTVRPDIAFAANKLARYMEAHGDTHWAAAKHVLRYMNGTVDMGIVYSSGGGTTVTAFADADFAGERDDRKSTSGYKFCMAGGVFSWRAKKQTLLAQRTEEAEYVSLASEVREKMWLRPLSKEMGTYSAEDVIVWCDNQAAVATACEERLTDAAKHIAIKYHLVRDEVEKGI